jgi:hypothetical protein
MKADRAHRKNTTIDADITDILIHFFSFFKLSIATPGVT